MCPCLSFSHFCDGLDPSSVFKLVPDLRPRQTTFSVYDGFGPSRVLRLSLVGRAFRVAAALYWNALPRNVIAAASLRRFVRYYGSGKLPLRDNDNNVVTMYKMSKN